VSYFLTRVVPAAVVLAAMLWVALAVMTPEGAAKAPQMPAETLAPATATECTPVRLTIGSAEWNGLLASGEFVVAVPDSDINVLIPKGCEQ
jgi:hypothetical protein